MISQRLRASRPPSSATAKPSCAALYTAKEQEYCERFKNKYERYAGRFAAKEAAMKALGTGWSRGVRWVDVEVVREKGGRPTMKLAGEAANIAERLQREEHRTKHHAHRRSSLRASHF